MDSIYKTFTLKPKLQYLSAYHLLPILISKEKPHLENSLAVQWLGLSTLTAEGPGSIPGQGTKIPQVTQHGRIKKKQLHLHSHTSVPLQSENTEVAKFFLSASD